MAEVEHTTEVSSNNTNMPDNHLHTRQDTNCNVNATKLIINYLPYSVTQEELHKMFSTVGEVESCVLMCDKTSFESLCFGFVGYFQPEDAANALKTFDRLKIQNKILKVSYARPSAKAIMNANLYVSGIPKEFTNTDLEKLFSPFGKIIESRVLCDKADNCCSKEVGFVRFDTRAEAEKAIEKLDGAVLSGVAADKPLFVKFAAHCNKALYNQQAHSMNPRDQHSGGRYNTNGMNPTPQPFLGGYNSTVKFTAHGNKVLYNQQQAHSMNPRDQRSGGRYTKFNTNGMNPTPAQPLLGGYNSMNPTKQYSGKPYYKKSNNDRMNHNPRSLLQCNSMQPNVQYAAGDAPCISMQATNSQMGTAMQASQNYNPMQGTPLVHPQLPGYDTMNSLGWSLYVGNFPPEMDENTLGRLFSQYGIVSKVKIIRQCDSPSARNFAFITMANYFQAVTAIHWLNGCTFNSYSLQVAFQNKSAPHKN